MLPPASSTGTRTGTPRGTVLASTSNVTAPRIMSTVTLSAASGSEMAALCNWRSESQRHVLNVISGWRISTTRANRPCMALA